MFRQISALLRNFLIKIKLIKISANNVFTFKQHVIVLFIIMLNFKHLISKKLVRNYFAKKINSTPAHPWMRYT